MDGKLSIKDWAADDRPREKMLRKGVAALSDAELLAILIGSGNQDESAVQLSQRILRFAGNNLDTLGKLSVADLSARFKGIGQAKAVAIASALELGKRRSASEGPRLAAVVTSQDAFRLFHPLLADLPHEEVWIALLNSKNKVIDKLRVGQGGVNDVAADVRIILKAAITALASSIILCHNHPSGSPHPSSLDDRLTHRLREAASLVDIHLSDHLILSGNSFYSYADEGKL